jgi:hypothetical protein
MVQAYTLSDRIVQQGFNDFQFLVGRVYKSEDAGTTFSELSLDEFNALQAPAYSVSQICTGRDVAATANTHDFVKALLDLDFNNGLGAAYCRLFKDWDDPSYIQIVQIRRVSVDLFGPSSKFNFTIVADAFTTPV